MNKKSKIHEKFLYEIWKKQKFSKNLMTSEDEQIIVLDCGIQNDELGGPDFKNARIKIGNITYVGDVEIDTQYADWKIHGHNINKKYNKVILHTVFNMDNHANVYTQEGRKVHSISFENLLEGSIKDEIQKAILNERNSRINKMPCDQVSEILNEDEKMKIIFDFGIERFKNKSQKMFERLKELSYIKEMKLKEPIISYELNEDFHNRKFEIDDFKDQVIWNQLMYEQIFEALGYSKNKEIMLKLARSADVKFLKLLDSDDFIRNAESALFNVAGLMPDVYNLPDSETSVYTRELYDLWSSIKQIYDGKIYNAAQWHFFKLRPQNFPTIRIAGGVRIVDQIFHHNFTYNVIKLFKNINSYGKIVSELRSLVVVKGEGFWSEHFIFDKPSKSRINYFIGVSRADEIIVNVILPIISVYFDIFGMKDLARKVTKTYINFYQQSENGLVKEVCEALRLNDAWKRTVMYQGMIEIFRNYCIKKKCLECPIGQKVFA